MTENLATAIVQNIAFIVGSMCLLTAFVAALAVYQWRFRFLIANGYEQQVVSVRSQFGKCWTKAGASTTKGQTGGN